MSQELLYTSSQKGLDPTKRGFCTVLATAGMPSNLSGQLERLSAYKHHFQAGSEDAKRNPVALSHVTARINGRVTSILSRVSDYKLDYSGRSNKLAHHIVLDANEHCQAGPAWLLKQSELIRADWDGECRNLTSGPFIPSGVQSSGFCQAWEAVTGDAGHAGVIADWILQSSKPIWIIHTVEQNAALIDLINEVIALLPEDERWNTTFSTYAGQYPPDITCKIRCVLEGTDLARMAPSLGFAISLMKPPSIESESVFVMQARGVSQQVLAPGSDEARVVFDTVQPNQENRQENQSPPPVPQKPESKSVNSPNNENEQRDSAAIKLRPPPPPKPHSRSPQPGILEAEPVHSSINRWLLLAIGLLSGFIGLLVLVIGFLVFWPNTSPSNTKTAQAVETKEQGASPTKGSKRGPADTEPKPERVDPDEEAGSGQQPEKSEPKSADASAQTQVGNNGQADARVDKLNDSGGAPSVEDGRPSSGGSDPNARGVERNDSRREEGNAAAEEVVSVHTAGPPGGEEPPQDPAGQESEMEDVKREANQETTSDSNSAKPEEEKTESSKSTAILSPQVTLVLDEFAPIGKTRYSNEKDPKLIAFELLVSGSCDMSSLERRFDENGIAVYYRNSLVKLSSSVGGGKGTAIRPASKKDEDQLIESINSFGLSADTSFSFFEPTEAAIGLSPNSAEKWKLSFVVSHNTADAELFVTIKCVRAALKSGIFPEKLTVYARSIHSKYHLINQALKTLGDYPGLQPVVKSELEKLIRRIKTCWGDPDERFPDQEFFLKFFDARGNLALMPIRNPKEKEQMRNDINNAKQDLVRLIETTKTQIELSRSERKELLAENIKQPMDFNLSYLQFLLNKKPSSETLTTIQFKNAKLNLLEKRAD